MATVVTIQEQQLLQQQQEQLEPPHTDGNRNSRHSTDQRAEHAVNGAAYASVLRLSCLHTHTLSHTHAQRVCLVSSSVGQLMTAQEQRQQGSWQHCWRFYVAVEVRRIPWPSLLLANS